MVALFYRKVRAKIQVFVKSMKFYYQSIKYFFDCTI
ncbi:hypothetical protein cje13_08417 [Campylobacter jejuni subsp. jejuni 86605]|nr:hypothetical protein cje13_08417 [Campylobacter jejuni subsp. jejuni 86605]